MMLVNSSNQKSNKQTERLESIKRIHDRDDSKFTNRMEDYLEVISELVEPNGFVLSKDISDYMNVSLPSVTKMLKRLDENDIFDGQRFLVHESWSYTFEEEDSFPYYCIIHPWMGGVVFVQQPIPDYPHDAIEKRIDEIPMYQITPVQSVEINFSWGPQVIKTNEKVHFIYRFYDAVNDLPLRKMQYDISIIHNGGLVFEDKNVVSGSGGDYRQWIYDEPGTTIVKISNIKPYGTVAEMSISFTDDATGRLADFSTIVYDNTEKTFAVQELVQPKQTFQIYYELAVALIIVPALLLLFIILYMKRKNSKNRPYIPERNASPV